MKQLFRVLVAFTAAVASAVAAAAAVPVDPHDLSGIWLNRAGTSALKPVDSAEPPMNTGGRAAYARAKSDLASGKAVDDVRKYCLPAGVPLTMSSPYPFRIHQGERQLTMIHEYHHTYRIVLIDDRHPPEDEAEPGFMGDSVGRWEGNTFVIDTAYFKASTPLDSTGLPHGERLHVVERLTRSADGRELVDQITIEDPEFYVRPWTVKVSYQLRNDLSIEPYACGEPHRDLSRVTRP